MKRIGMLFLVLAMILGLWGCASEETAAVKEQITATDAAIVDSAAAEEVKAVQELIAAIGEVDENSEAAITAAEEAYAALTEEGKAAVENAEVLFQARRTLKGLTIPALLQGTWYVETTFFSEKNNSYKSLYTTIADLPVSTDKIPFTSKYGESWNLSMREFCIQEDQFYCNAKPVGNACIGTYELSEELDAIIIHVEVEGLGKDTYTMKILEEDGFVKLSGDYPTENSLSFVREEDLAAAFEAKYVHMQLNGENMLTYFGDPVDLGYIYDENGERITSVVDEESGLTIPVDHVTILPSKAYEQGLVYLEGGTFNYNAGSGQSNYPMVIWSSEATAQSLTGGSNACFIRADHVAKNYIDETGCRVLELTDGNVIRYESDEYLPIFCQVWKYLDVDYNDYIF